MKLKILVILVLLGTVAAQRSSKKGDRKGKQSESRKTVVSCRVFRKGVCNKSASNIITVNKSIKNSNFCQQFCYFTPGCAAFTHFEESREESRKCVLFKDCNGKLSDCKDCISGPIMPRITECLAAKQEVAPAPAPAEDDYLEYENEVAIDESIFEEDDAVDFEEDYQEDYDAAAAEDNFDVAYDYDDYDEDYEDDYEVDSADTTGAEPEDNFETEMMDDEDLDEEGVTEEEDEIPDEDVNIDSGFLNDDEGKSFEVATVPPQTKGTAVASTASNAPTFIFFFCAMGGVNHNGPVSAVDIISNGISAALTQALSIAPMPSKVTRGGECSAAYTGQSITSCSNGYTILSPYGFQYKPGSCMDYNLNSNDWKETGAKLTSYRKGGTMSKLGRYLMATGGVREKRALRSIELFDPKKPERGWRRMARMTMPVAVSEHCTVTLKGRNGKEIVITGGKGREGRALKLDIKNNKWYSLNRLNNGRRKHACVKATLNGRTGVVVSGGISKGDKNMTSVEFYDAATGEWYNLPSLRRGRQSHAMVVNKGRLMVAGGVSAGRKGREYLDDVEIFTGRKWVKSMMKLDRPRAGFSLVKIPRSGKALGGSSRRQDSKRKTTSRKSSKRKPSSRDTAKRGNKRKRVPRRN